MAYLSKEQILGADDLVSEDVSVPEWGGIVRIKTLTGKERDAFEASLVDAKSKGQQMKLANLRARFVSLCIVDENGSRMFSDDEIKKLGTKSSAALQRVWDAGRKLSGLTEEDAKVMAEDLDDDQSDDSTSD